MGDDRRPPPQLVGYTTGDISPRITSNQQKRRRRLVGDGGSDPLEGEDEVSDPLGGGGGGEVLQDGVGDYAGE